MSFKARGRNWRHFFKTAASIVVMFACCVIAGVTVLNNAVTFSGSVVIVLDMSAAPISVWFALFITEWDLAKRLAPIVVTVIIILAIYVFAGPLTLAGGSNTARADQHTAVSSTSAT